MSTSLPRATSVLGHGHWRQSAADCVVLNFDDRHRRRITLQGVSGLAFLLDLPEAVALRSGDALVMEDGRLVEVIGAPEPLSEIRCANAQALVRMAWHLGNRHLATQITANALRIRQDHVIEEMARGLGAKVVRIEAAFDPEGGAYAAHAPAPSAHPDNAHHGRSHKGHDHPAGHGHVHGPGCGHGH